MRAPAISAYRPWPNFFVLFYPFPEQIFLKSKTEEKFYRFLSQHFFSNSEIYSPECGSQAGLAVTGGSHLPHTGPG